MSRWLGDECRDPLVYQAQREPDPGGHVGTRATIHQVRGQ